ncbi:MAG: molybdopterin molybdenumtransferase MoeA [Leeuwenhoekiella sp.]|nr:MAG: molybdopterin molybdenumtransferase MoeA [Leeuwenhoekiella sp.]
MIAVSEAQKLIEAHSNTLQVIEVELEEAFGHYLAEDLNAPISLPSFRQSAMDGYAIIHSESKTLKITGQVQAGDVQVPALNPGEAIRIFTGAPVPELADTVIIQEHTTREGDNLILNQIPPKNANVRPVGEQLKAGDLALTKGHRINEASTGFLAGLGFTSVKVYKKPRVALLTTGNELQQRGAPLKPNHIYESNGIMLEMALKRIGISQIEKIKVPDTLEATVKAVKKALEQADVLLISGGISVGDYDFVQEALSENGVQEHFYKVNQKPGKPLWYGTQADQSVFGLPGNPASSLTCFYVYVLPHLRLRMGSEKPFLEEREAILQQDLLNPHDKTLFLKAGVDQNGIMPFTGQASSMLNTYAVSNALLIIEPHQTEVKQGDTVTYLDLNF